MSQPFNTLLLWGEGARRADEGNSTDTESWQSSDVSRQPEVGSLTACRFK